MNVWRLDLNDSKGMIREKGEFMLGLCEQCMGESLVTIHSRFFGTSKKAGGQ